MNSLGSHPSQGNAATAGLPHGVSATTRMSVDQQLLLLSLSDQYINEARTMATEIAFSQTDNVGLVTQYSKLMATGLTCLEMVAIKWNHTFRPRQLATLQLRYATLLFEETENLSNAEEVLGKGIALCERNHLLDLQYSMQHLLVRVMSKTNLRASIKLLEALIHMSSTCQHTPWMYAFRFLRVSICFRFQQNAEIATALINLKVLLDLSRNRGDVTITTITALLEAQVHLHARSSDAIDQAQRALAIARSHQLGDLIEEAPQILLLIQILDLACSLDPFKYAQSRSKMDAMQVALDAANERGQWTRSGTFYLPIEGSSDTNLTQETNELFISPGNGKLKLAFQWINRTEVVDLFYLLSGVALHCKSPKHSHMSESLLSEGLKRTEADLNPSSPSNSSLSTQIDQAHWLKQLRASIVTRLALVQCARSNWEAASHTLRRTNKLMKFMQAHGEQQISLLASYLNGVIHQGVGRLDLALQIYQSAHFALPATPSPTNTFGETLALLASMNMLLLISSSSHSSHHLAPSLFNSLRPYFEDKYDRPEATSSASKNLSASNDHLQSSYFFLRALYTIDRSSPQHDSNFVITDTKRHLHKSLQAAKRASDPQLVTLGLVQMHNMFFADMVGQQTEDTVKAIKENVRETGDLLWASVANGLVAGIMDRTGRNEEALNWLQYGQSIVGKLPPQVQETLAAARKAPTSGGEVDVDGDRPMHAC
ncbi:MAG: hypothetical protein M1828_002884 [Chrysothrix sp. TS-e1954]|nr:MAG: hypothetical protein M1828_002884 [Chrysothrix sp. TS-e1954]